MGVDLAAPDRLLAALGEQLAAAGTRFELVVIGGSALIAHGLVFRTTRDVDVLALRTGDELVDPRPMPAPLAEASNRVARDFGVGTEWLNPGPASLLDFGLPDGFIARLERRDYGSHLVVDFASRYDQIHFKVYATVDQGPGKHEADLRDLAPTRAELVAAARWARTHDPSQAFREELLALLTYLGVDDADLDD